MVGNNHTLTHRATHSSSSSSSSSSAFSSTMPFTFAQSSVSSKPSVQDSKVKPRSGLMETDTCLLELGKCLNKLYNDAQSSNVRIRVGGRSEQEEAEEEEEEEEGKVQGEDGSHRSKILSLGQSIDVGREEEEEEEQKQKLQQEQDIQPVVEAIDNQLEHAFRSMGSHHNSNGNGNGSSHRNSNSKNNAIPGSTSSPNPSSVPQDKGAESRRYTVFYAHQDILVARSGFFRTLFSDRWRLSKARTAQSTSIIEIEITEFSPLVIECVLQYMYGIPMNRKLDQDTLLNVIRASEFYQLEGLHERLSSLSADQILQSGGDIIETVYMMLSSQCERWISESELHCILEPCFKSFEKYWKSQVWIQFDHDMLLTILKFKRRPLFTEILLLKIIFRWAYHQYPQARRLIHQTQRTETSTPLQVDGTFVDILIYLERALDVGVGELSTTALCYVRSEIEKFNLVIPLLEHIRFEAFRGRRHQKFLDILLKLELITEMHCMASQRALNDSQQYEHFSDSWVVDNYNIRGEAVCCKNIPSFYLGFSVTLKPGAAAAMFPSNSQGTQSPAAALRNSISSPLSTFSASTLSVGVSTGPALLNAVDASSHTASNGNPIGTLSVSNTSLSVPAPGFRSNWVFVENLYFQLTCNVQANNASSFSFTHTALLWQNRPPGVLSDTFDTQVDTNLSVLLVDPKSGRTESVPCILSTATDGMMSGGTVVGFQWSDTIELHVSLRKNAY